jgi:hypothetical protein
MFFFEESYFYSLKYVFVFFITIKSSEVYIMCLQLGQPSS